MGLVEGFTGILRTDDEFFLLPVQYQLRQVAYRNGFLDLGHAVQVAGKVDPCVQVFGFMQGAVADAYQNQIILFGKHRSEFPVVLHGRMVVGQDALLFVGQFQTEQIGGEKGRNKHDARQKPKFLTDNNTGYFAPSIHNQ